jgi:hypothetical protein
MSQQLSSPTSRHDGHLCDESAFPRHLDPHPKVKVLQRQLLARSRSVEGSCDLTLAVGYGTSTRVPCRRQATAWLSSGAK